MLARRCTRTELRERNQHSLLWETQHENALRKKSPITRLPMLYTSFEVIRTLFRF